MDPEDANLNMDGPNKVDKPQADRPNKGGHTVLTWLPRG